MIDQELLTACVVNSWSVVPRMMLIDSMIENGWTEFKALEAFEPPTITRYLPTIYGGGRGSGYGNCDGIGSGNLIDGDGNGSGSCYGFGCGYIINDGRGNGRNNNGYRDDK